MTLLGFINELKKMETIGFQLPNGTFVPPYFHVTEVGKVTRDFIDCGGTLRSNSVVNFQLWSAEDYDHRLHPEKLISIIEMAQKSLAIGDLPIEVEFQGQTIETYGIATQGNHFLLTTKATDCLAKDNCGIPTEKPKISLSEVNKNTCTPGSGCC